MSIHSRVPQFKLGPGTTSLRQTFGSPGENWGAALVFVLLVVLGVFCSFLLVEGAFSFLKDFCADNPMLSHIVTTTNAKAALFSSHPKETARFQGK